MALPMIAVGIDGFFHTKLILGLTVDLWPLEIIFTYEKSCSVLPAQGEVA